MGSRRSLRSAAMSGHSVIAISRMAINRRRIADLVSSDVPPEIEDRAMLLIPRSASSLSSIASNCLMCPSSRSTSLWR